MSPSTQCAACQAALNEDQSIACSTTTGTTARYLRCPNCASLTLHPLPRREEIPGLYPPDYYGTADTKLPAALEHVRDWSHHQRATWVHRSLSATSGTVLDIGCGSGRFLQSLSHRNWCIYGTELPGPAANRAAAVSGIHLSLTDEIQTNTFPGARFDAITLWHVLEHVRDPGKLLSQCRQLLHPTGRLFLEIPNLGSLQAQWSGTRWLHLDPPRHLHQFTPNGLQALLNRAGFHIDTQATRSLSMGTFGAIQSMLNHVTTPRDYLYSLLLTRGKTPPPGALRKILTFLAGALLAPPALLFTLVESALGKGAVLRYRCSPKDPPIGSR